MDKKIGNETKYSRKLGLFSIDAAFAVIIVITMSIIFYLIIQSTLSSLQELSSRQKMVSLIVFSNQIVRNEGAYKTNTETFSNLISKSELSLLKAQILSNTSINEYRFNYINWSLINLGTNAIVDSFSTKSDSTNLTEIYCINRFVIIEEENVEGVLRICIS